MKLRRRLGFGLLAFLILVVLMTIIYYPRQVDQLSTQSAILARSDYKAFYGANYYGVDQKAFPGQQALQNAGIPYPVSDFFLQQVTSFVRQYRLEKAHVLEVGSGPGGLQDVVADYIGLDFAGSQRRFYHKPFVEASATNMPFPDDEFDAIWTIDTLEHVPKPEQALSEMRRVLKDNGLLYLEAAWQTRSWKSQGYNVRPYSDFDFRGKLTKASIPLRDSVAYRALYTAPIRLIRLLASQGGPTRFRYTLLQPNYERCWEPDSDAVNSMDPYETILWFKSRGDEILAYQGMVNPFFVRSGAIIIRVHKSHN